MSNRKVLARLRITPSFSAGPQSHTFTLVKIGDSARIETVLRRGGIKPERWRVDVPIDEVDRRLAALQTATIRAYPVSPSVCDGSYIELSIFGANADLSLSWWAIAPEGAEALDEFADWLVELGDPDDRSLD